MSPWEKLHAWYSELGFSLDGSSAEAPASLAPTPECPFAVEADLVAFEQKNNLLLPADFREHLLHFYRDAAPFDEQHWIEFWPITWLVTVPNEVEFYRYKQPLEAAHEYVHFADHFIRGRDWVINCGKGPDRGRVLELGGPHSVDCASFAEFVEIVVTEPERVATF